ncbi:hypothetical protein ACIBQ5_05395 [Streptomyces massasporeus]|uniref:hypothetical protein n=1 Tax=Streptomyces massasporeus TaxID=67324 RepID=UPI0037B812E0
MNARTVTCFALLTLAALTASCSSGGDSDKPASPAPTVTATKTVDPAAARKACVDAWADVIASRPEDWDPETGEDPEPSECAGLPADDYTDMYMEGLSAANRRAIADAQQEIEDASEAAQP